MSAQKPQAIIFDWDNTLVESWQVIHLTLNATLVHYGMAPWTVAQTRARVRKSLRDSFPLLFGDRWQEAGEFFYDYFETIHLDKLTALAGAEDLLAGLAAQGVYLGVVSNKKGEHLRTEVDFLGWNGYFGKVVGANDAKQDKPAADPVHMALSPGGIAAGPGVWFVGDADIDMECAFNAGCVPVLLRKQAPAGSEFELAPPLYHVAGCPDLGELIKS
ncbi:MAG TPA: HAD family hydrolase, partial [Rhodospirillales bacterium]|nr:HAD family hydrolase [Rhodospirillales bacterium]